MAVLRGKRVSRYRIPFNRPALVGEELRYVREAIEGGHLSGDGPFSRRCCHLLESWLGVERAMMSPVLMCFGRTRAGPEGIVLRKAFFDVEGRGYGRRNRGRYRGSSSRCHE